jgi:hypothetical protein
MVRSQKIEDAHHFEEKEIRKHRRVIRGEERQNKKMCDNYKMSVMDE